MIRLGTFARNSGCAELTSGVTDRKAKAKGFALCANLVTSLRDVGVRCGGDAHGNGTHLDDVGGS